MTSSKIRNFFESLQSFEENDMNEIIIHVFIVLCVVVLMIKDIRAFETKNAAFLFQNQ